MSIENLRLTILDSGEHILGEATVNDDGSVDIKTPVSMVPNPQTQGQMMFIPYLQFSVEDTANFPKRVVRHVLTPVHQLAASYDQQFGSQIEIPPQGIVGANGLSLVN